MREQAMKNKPADDFDASSDEWDWWIRNYFEPNEIEFWNTLNNFTEVKFYKKTPQVWKKLF